MRRNVIRAAPEQDAAVLELLIRQLRIVAEQHGRHPVVRTRRDRQPRRAELALERLRSADIDVSFRRILAEIVHRCVRRRQKILWERLDAEALHFCDVGVRPARGVVRQEQIPPANPLHIVQKVDCPVK